MPRKDVGHGGADRRFFDVRRMADAYSASRGRIHAVRLPDESVTGSYFFCWGVFDSAAGRQRRRWARWQSIYAGLSARSRSDWPFRAYAGVTDGSVRSRGCGWTACDATEFVTGTLHRCISPAGYMGSPGEIWFVRILPEPYDSLQMEYSSCSTRRIDRRRTTAALRRPTRGRGRSFSTGQAEDRNQDTRDAYGHLMKYGLSVNYWNEYVMESYVNHRHDMIMPPAFRMYRPAGRTRETCAMMEQHPSLSTGGLSGAGDAVKPFRVSCDADASHAGPPRAEHAESADRTVETLRPLRTLREIAWVAGVGALERESA